ncbi:hypothetical protein C5D34_12100 [Rathayibacter sp. AY1B1]|nr:hypothetical protein C5D08_01405 [Rathayibacter sp. AY1B6]PPI32032.1 hypothetical protein C5D34_12100 [Rathayibacter sp. AY1B1]
MVAPRGAGRTERCRRASRSERPSCRRVPVRRAAAPRPARSGAHGDRWSSAGERERPSSSAPLGRRGPRSTASVVTGDVVR